MALAVASYTVQAWDLSPPLLITKPSGLAVGDLMYVVIATLSNNAGTVTPPSGFTALDSVDAGVEAWSSFYKVAVQADVDATTFSFTTSDSEGLAGIMFRITGAGATPTMTNRSTQKSASGVFNSADLTPAAANSLFIFSIMNINTQTPSGYAMAVSNPTWTDVGTVTGSGIVLGAGYAVRAAATASGDFNVSGTDNFHYGGFICIAPGVNNYTTTLTESVVLVDTIKKQASKVLSQAIVLVATISKIANRTFVDTVVLVDTILRSVSRTFSEAITLVDTVIKNTTMRVLSEVVTLVDTFSSVRITVIEFLESTSIQDTFLKAYSTTKSEVITLVDTFSRVWLSFITFVEEITLVDTFTRITSKIFEEVVSLTDTFTRIITKVLSEVVTLVDTFVKQSTRVLTEVIVLVDTISKLPSRVMEEVVSLTDTITQSISRTFSEVVTLVDTFTKEMTRVFSEVVTLVDTFARQVSKSVVYTETITLVSIVLRAITNFVARLPFIKGGRSESNFKTGTREDAGGIKGNKADGGMTGERF